MNALPFVIAAYAEGAIGIGGYLVWSWVPIRRVEKAADALRGTAMKPKHQRRALAGAAVSSSRAAPAPPVPAAVMVCSGTAKPPAWAAAGASTIAIVRALMA